MARLGELLVATGLVESEKVEQALRAQVVWGGRLGTNLIELGFIDLDGLSRALGRHHDLPAALAHHFDRADSALQLLLPAEIADRHSFVPILRLTDNKIAGAAMDPLGPAALAEIASAMGVGTEELVVAVAAEQRMRYQLERVFGIARSTRYLRSRGPRFPSFPAFDNLPTEPDVEFELPDVGDFAPEEQAVSIDWEEPPAIAAQRASTDELEAMIEEAASTAPPSPPSSSPGSERRRYVPTLADAEADPRPSATPQTLGRIAIRKIAVPTRPPANLIPPATTLAEAARAIRRGGDREQVADLVMDAVERFAPSCYCAVLLIVRGDAATTWRSFCRSSGTPPEIAVPLDEPGVVPTAVNAVQTARAKDNQQSPIDKKLLAALGNPNCELAAIPIAVSATALGVLAVAIDADEPIPNVDTIATAAGAALGRLMRDAAR